MTVRVVSTQDQQTLTVNDLIANPLLVPNRVLETLSDQFVMDRILRYGGQASGGAVAFRVSSGLFAAETSEIVEEFGEVPVAAIDLGDLKSERTRERALAVVISRQMRDRDNMGEVNRQIEVVRNTIVRDVDGAFVSKLRSELVAAGQTHAATAAWSGGGATIRKDINAARLLVSNSQIGGAGTQNFTGFRPDTLLISPTTETDLLNSSEFTALLFGSANASNIGSVNGRTLLDLNVLVSPSVGDNEAFVLQSKMVGGYADEHPLEATELYEHRPNRTWRSDTSRSTAGFIDQPFAGAQITGV